MITRIEATNYRCFERLDVDLREYAILVGANGAGKTTLLDIPVLLGDLLKQSGRQTGIGTAFLESHQPRGTRASHFAELIFQNKGNSFIFAVEARLPEWVVKDIVGSASSFIKQNREYWPRSVRYEVCLQVFNERELQVTNEYVFTFSEKHVPKRAKKDDINAVRLHGDINPHKKWNFSLKRESGGESEFHPEVMEPGKSRRPTARRTAVSADRLALAMIGFESREKYPAARWLLDLLTHEAVFFAPNLIDLRSASPPGLPTRITADGKNLPWLAMELSNEDPERFSDWVEHVQTALPQVERIEAQEREEDHHAYFKVAYHGGYEVTSSGLSDGTLRVLALTLLPYLQKQPTILMVEEPENGIHPRAIEAVLQSLSSMYSSQVWISSHSPVVLAHSKLPEILCARLEDSGAVTVVPGSRHPRLVEWQGSLDLGSLFAAGVLG